MNAPTVARALVLVGCLAGCQQSPQTPPAATGQELSGVWQSGGTSYKIASSDEKVSATFEVVSPEAEALGFKKGDFSFEGVRKGTLLHGEQLIRYPADNPCHKNGRRVPFMGLVSADGRQLVLDWYSVTVDVQTCRDLGRTLGVTDRKSVV